MKQSNLYAHRTQTTFLTHPTILEYSGAAQLLVVIGGSKDSPAMIKMNPI